MSNLIMPKLVETIDKKNIIICNKMKSNVVIICLVSLILWEFNIFNLKQSHTQIVVNNIN